MFKGCEVKLMSITHDSPLNMTFPVQQKIDGFVARFKNESDPENSRKTSKLVLETSVDRWQTSNKIGSLALRWDRFGVRFLDQPVSFSTQIFVHYTPPWPWFIFMFIPQFVWAGFCFSFCTCGIMRLPTVAKIICSCSLGILALSNLTSAAGFLSLGMKMEALGPSIGVVAYACIACSVNIAEALVIDVFTVAAAASLVSAAAYGCAAHDSDDCRNLADDPPVAPAFFFAFGLALLALRRRAYRSALDGVGPDQAIGDQAWSALVHSSSSESVDSLRRLDALLAQAQGGCCAFPRQLARKPCSAARDPRRVLPTDDPDASFAININSGSVLRVGPGDDAGSSLAGDPASGEACPIASLDQLYSQALGAAQLLHARCVAWAALSRGELDDGCKPRPGDLEPDDRDGPRPGRREEAGQGLLSMRWRSHRFSAHGGGADAYRCDVPGTSEWWAGRRCVKHPDRAVEKAAACYGGDPSRLLDVCRARIAFAGPADLLACAEAVLRRSPDVRVVRIRNGLTRSRAHDPRRSAGYRVSRGGCIRAAVRR